MSVTVQTPSPQASDVMLYQPMYDAYDRVINQDDLPRIEEDLYPEDVVRLLFLSVDSTPALVLQKCVVKMSHGPNSNRTTDSFSEWACISTTDCSWKPLFLEGLAVIGRLDILHILGLDEREIRKLQNPVHLSSLKVSMNQVCCSLCRREMNDLIRHVSASHLPGRNLPNFPDGRIIKQLLELHILFWMQEGIMDLTDLSVLAGALVRIGRPDLENVLIGRPSVPYSAVSATGTSSLQGERSKVVGLPLTGEPPAMSIMYPNNSGVCVVFNQEQFGCCDPECDISSLRNHGCRFGSTSDARNLHELFTSFQCRTEIFTNLKALEIKVKLEELAMEHDLHGFDYLVVCFLSHGGSKGHRPHIYGSDCRKLIVTDLVSPFESDRCPALRGKMKMVITQACQGDGKLSPVRADGPSDSPPASLPSFTMSDFLFCQASTPGFMAYRDPWRGSFYIQKLCEVLGSRGHLEEVTLCIKDVHNLLIKSPIQVGDDRRQWSIQPQMIDCTRGRFRFRRSKDVPPQAG